MMAGDENSDNIDGLKNKLFDDSDEDLDDFVRRLIDQGTSKSADDNTINESKPAKDEQGQAAGSSTDQKVHPSKAKDAIAEQRAFSRALTGVYEVARPAKSVFFGNIRNKFKNKVKFRSFAKTMNS